MAKKCGHINDCGCKDRYLTTPPPCPPGEPCEEAQPCSYYTDFQCVIYTGPTLMCGEEVLLETGSLLSDVITDLAQRVCELETNSCNLLVSITQIEDGSGDIILEAIVSNGSGNYTYGWSIADNIGIGNISTNPFDQQVQITASGGGPFAFTLSLIKVLVTDNVTGCQSQDTFLVNIPLPI